jgi:DNA-binding GntR family transcriptional regulator
VTFKSVTITELVYRKLKDEIIAGELKPGSRIIETSLARRYNVSRTPLREAVKLLEQDHLVERLPQGGVLVSPLSQEEAREANQVRSALEALAAQLAATKVRDKNLTVNEVERLKQLDEICRALRLHLRMKEDDLLLKAGSLFHKTIHQLAGNKRATSVLEQTMEAMQRYRIRIPRSRQERVVEEHSAIAETIRRGDAEAAGRLMREHILAADVFYQRSIEPSNSAANRQEMERTGANTDRPSS